MHGANMKIVDAKQAKICYACNNIRIKLLKTNAALWFNKMCKIKQLKPNYIQFKSNGKFSFKFNGHDRTILVILAKCCIRLPDDGSFVIRNMLENF